MRNCNSVARCMYPSAGYLDAVGPGIHLQIGRTVSVDKTLGKASLYRDGSASFMLESDSLQDEVGTCAWMNCTCSASFVVKTGSLQDVVQGCLGLVTAACNSAGDEHQLCLKISSDSMFGDLLLACLSCCHHAFRKCQQRSTDVPL